MTAPAARLTPCPGPQDQPGVPERRQDTDGDHTRLGLRAEKPEQGQGEDAVGESERDDEDRRRQAAVKPERRRVALGEPPAPQADMGRDRVECAKDEGNGGEGNAHLASGPCRACQWKLEQAEEIIAVSLNRDGLLKSTLACQVRETTFRTRPL